MDELNNGCIILKRKEYEELLEKANKNKPSEIIIHWARDMYHYRSWYAREHISGSFDISDKISTQIRRIIRLSDEKYESMLREFKSKIAEEEAIKFSKLSWWNRLFFKKDGKNPSKT